MRFTNSILDIFDGWQLLAEFLRDFVSYPVLADTNWLIDVPQGIFGNQVVLALAQEQADSGRVLLCLQDIIHCRQIEVQLAGIVRLEVTRLAPKEFVQQPVAQIPYQGKFLQTWPYI